MWEKLLNRAGVSMMYRDEAGGDGGAGGGAGGSTNDDPKGGQGDDKGGQGKDDDKGGPSDAEAKLLKEVMQKKEALKVAQAELSKLKDAVKKYEGIDLDKVKALIKEAEDQEKKQLEAKGDFERLKQKIIEEAAAEKKTLQEKLQEKDQQLSKHSEIINSLTIGHAFSTSKFIADELTLTPSKAKVVYEPYFDVVDGQVVAFDKPRGSSNRTPIVDARGEAVPFEEALKKILDTDPDRDQLLKSKMKQGAGSKSNIEGKLQEKKSLDRGVNRIAKALAEQKQKK